MILKVVIVFVVLIYKADVTLQWKAPTFLSAWHFIEANNTGELVITHGLGSVPAKVDVQVKIVKDGVDYIFTGAGTAHRDNGHEPEYGGVVYIYNSSHVIIYVPTVAANNQTFGGVAYTGSEDDYDGPAVIRGWYGSGHARVRAWTEDDFPIPVFNKTITMDDCHERCYYNYEYPGSSVDLVIAQIEIGNGYFTEGQGNIFQNDTKSSDYGMGGVLFGYDDDDVELWSPIGTSQNSAWNGAVYVRHNGWGYSDDYVDSGNVTIKGYIVSHLFRKIILASTTPQAPVATSNTIQFDKVYNLDSSLVIVQVREPNKGCDGMVYNGAGSAMTTEQKYSGVVYVYTNESALLYTPSSDRGYMIYIDDRWGNREESSTERYADIIVTVYGTGPSCRVPDVDSVTANFTLTNGLEPGSIVSYTCRPNYQHTFGDITRTCTASGTWNGTRPSCTMIEVNPVVCLSPIVEFARFTLSDGLQQGSIVNYTCSHGYTYSSGSLIRICMSDGTWNGSDPVCNEVFCGDPAVNFTTHNLTDDLNHGSFVQYKCISGYSYVSGYLTRYCDNGNWIGQPPVCSEKPCNDPGPVWNANYSLSGLSVGSNVTYICNTSSVYNAGDLIRTCEFGGSWSGLSPVCLATMCTLPSNVNASTYLITSLNVGGEIVYTCNPGYGLKSGNLTRTCDLTGQWDGYEPICTEKPCTEPDSVTNASYTYSELSVGSHVTYTCNNGTFYKAGNLTRTCELGGSWNGFPPVCLEIKCVDPGSVHNSTYSITGFHPGDTAIYTCNSPSQQHAGDSVRRCQDDGTWSGIPIVCLSGSSCLANTPVIHSAESLAAQVEQTKKELTVVKEETSAYKRTLNCAKDSRPSAKYLGLTGVIVLCSIALALIIPDLLNLFRHICERRRGRK